MVRALLLVSYIMGMVMGHTMAHGCSRNRAYTMDRLVMLVSPVPGYDTELKSN